MATEMVISRFPVEVTGFSVTLTGKIPFDIASFALIQVNWLAPQMTKPLTSSRAGFQLQDRK